MNEEFADAGGVRIRYTDHGGEGDPLVLVHATGFHRRVWDPWLPELCSRFRVVTLDQRGHGDSDKPPDGYDWELLATDVLAVTDACGLVAPAAAGHSAGGAALVLAEAQRPGTFASLVLMDPVIPETQMGAWMRGSDNPLSQGARRRRPVWDSVEQMVERMQTKSPLAAWRPEFLRAYVQHGTSPREDGSIELKCPPDIEAKVYEGGGAHRGWDVLPTLGCEVLLLLGESSDIWSGERGDQLAQRVANGRMQRIPQAGHFFPMQSPQPTLERVLAFLES